MSLAKSAKSAGLPANPIAKSGNYHLIVRDAQLCDHREQVYLDNLQKVFKVWLEEVGGDKTLLLTYSLRGFVSDYKELQLPERLQGKVSVKSLTKEEKEYLEKRGRVKEFTRMSDMNRKQMLWSIPEKGEEAEFDNRHLRNVITGERMISDHNTSIMEEKLGRQAINIFGIPKDLIDESWDNTEFCKFVASYIKGREYFFKVKPSRNNVMEVVQVLTEDDFTSA